MKTPSGWDVEKLKRRNLAGGKWQDLEAGRIRVMVGSLPEGPGDITMY